MQAQAPVILCADVQAGDVVLSWELPVPAYPTIEYDVFWLTPDNGAWENIGEDIDASQVPFPHTVNAGLGPQQYYIQSIVNGVSGLLSDTISTIFLELGPDDNPIPQDNEGYSIAVLEWNAPFTEMPAGSEYTVLRRVEGEAAFSEQAVLASDELLYRDTLWGFCDEVKIHYQIAFENGPCTMHSQIVFDEFQDDFAPLPPIVETITYDPFTDKVYIYWNESPEPDFGYYEIRRVTPDITFTVDGGTIYKGEPTVFEYDDPSDSLATTMGVVAFDSCGTDQWYGAEYSTMFAKSDYVNCTSQAVISWTPYEGWPEGVESYTLHIQSNGGNFDEYSGLSPNQTDFILETVPNLEYYIYVEAISNGDQLSSKSNMTDFIATYPEPISDNYNYLSNVTTLSEDSIQVELLQDPNAEGMSYQLMRKVGGANFQPKGSRIYQTNYEVRTYLDTDVDADVTIYTYKWRFFDGCGVELTDLESNESKNMVLTAGTSNEGLSNTLQWNHYESWEGGVQEYQIYRKLGSETEFTWQKTVPSDQTYWEDDVEDFMLEEGLFCYKVVAIENPNTTFDKTSESTSNEACAVQEPLMWIPNTIVVNGFNKMFAPVAGFIDFSSYEMEIHSKAGTQLFYTDDISEGWYGTYRGMAVKEDYYRYTIVYRDGAGQHFLKQGAVYVLHAEK